MAPYIFRKTLLRIVSGLPAPKALDRVARFYARTRAAEGFGDMSINGELRFLREHGRDCRVVFDVGAQVGNWTEAALRLCPRAQIHAFEPMRATYAQLLARGFPAERVVCNPVGLSDAEGQAAIHTRSTSLYDRTLPGDERRDGDPETVRLTTLTQYCAEQGIAQIDLLKVDAEGHDLAVLRGGEELIRAGRISRIQFEYGTFNIYARVLLRDFYEFFAGLPYLIYLVTPKGLVPYPEYPLHLENFAYKNFVALHELVSTPSR